MSDPVAPILLARTDAGVEPVLLPGMANRHGLITGATGTGKTVTLQVLAERFSNLGVPTFMADVKGDLSGLAAPGAPSPKLTQRLEAHGLPTPSWAGAPVVFWDLFGKAGHPIRATVSDMGPLLLSRLLDLSDTQSGVMTVVFRVADDSGMLLLDLKDLRAMVQHVGERAADYQTQYGNIDKRSVGVIQRTLLALEDQGGDQFFGEPMLDIRDLMRTGPDGRGAVNILAAESLMRSPKVYSTFLLWLLSELFEQLPEAGDPPKPRLVFFFDEAHLLFDDTPDALVDKIEQVVRLIRSKGVGVFFVTQNPLDVPDRVLGQLGNRVQHALRAFTPRDQQAVKTAADTMRSNPAFDTAQAITELGVGEALVSCLDVKGSPSVVERAWMMPPASRIGPLSPAERGGVMGASPLAGKYDAATDRESAYEQLAKRAAERQKADVSAPAGKPGEQSWSDVLFGSTGPRGGRREGIIESAARSAARSMGSGVGRSLLRGVLGSLLGRK